MPMVKFSIGISSQSGLKPPGTDRSHHTSDANLGGAVSVFWSSLLPEFSLIYLYEVRVHFPFDHYHCKGSARLSPGCPILFQICGEFIALGLCPFRHWRDQGWSTCYPSNTTVRRGQRLHVGWNRLLEFIIWNLETHNQGKGEVLDSARGTRGML